MGTYNQTPYLQQLNQSIEGVANTLLMMEFRDEKAMLSRLINSTGGLLSHEEAEALGVFRPTETPSAHLVGERIMGGTNNYSLEMKVSGAIVGLTLLTNYNRIDQDLNQYLDIVPVYVIQNGRVHWFHQAITPVLAFTMTATFQRVQEVLDQELRQQAEELGRDENGG